MKAIILDLSFFNRCCLLAILSLTLCESSHVLAQGMPYVTGVQIDSDVVKHHSKCGLNPSFLALHGITASNPVPNAMIGPASFPASAIETCGHFEIYYEDLLTSNAAAGFKDAATGVARRNTLCAVLNYIENTFADFSSPSMSGKYIRLYVQQSYSVANLSLSPPPLQAPPGVMFAAEASSFFDNSLTGITNGYMHDFIRTGTDPNPGGYHASLILNFDGANITSPYPPGYVPYTYTTGTGPAICGSYDLFSVLLHQMGHCMGWFSLLECTPPASIASYPMQPITPNRIITSQHEYSGLDNSLYVGTPAVGSGSSFTKVIINTPSAALNTSSTVDAQNNYWVNNMNAPGNYPVYSGLFTGVTPMPSISFSFFSHLDEQCMSYAARERISPGDRQENVMSPYTYQGRLTRAFTKGELQTFANAMNYPLIGSVNALNNQLPYSTRMAGYPSAYWEQHTMYQELVPTDYTITNNTGLIPIKINLNGPNKDVTLTDGDNDPLAIYPGSLFNIRGCGMGNSIDANILSLNATADEITFTPRANFYGRAQFGFNLWDGKEKGGFVVYTIEVSKGTGVSIPAGANLVLNGDFEQGTQTFRAGADELVPNVEDKDYTYSERRFGGSMMSDCHPYNFLSTFVYGLTPTSKAYSAKGVGDAVKNLLVNCSNASYARAGNANNVNSFGIAAPVQPPLVGDRYGIITSTGNSSLPVYGQYLSLGDDVQQCHKYKLEFDVQTPAGPVTTPTFNFTIGFFSANSTTNWFTPTLNFTLPTSQTTISYTNNLWQHLSYDFYYCGTATSNTLYIDAGNFYANSGLVPLINIDNISVKEDVSPLPLTLNVTQTLIAPCTDIELKAIPGNVYSYACAPVTYDWKSGGILLGTGNTLSVPNASGTYTVDITDGCRTATTTVNVTPISAPVVTITPSATSICSGTSTTLTANAGSGFTGYTWSPATGLSSTSGTSITANPTSTTTYTVTASGGTGCTATGSVVVTVAPAVTPTVSVTNQTICAGGSASVTASGGTTYSWTAGLSGPVINTGATLTISLAATTTYYVTANGCTSAVSSTVNVSPLPPVTVSSSAAGNSVCPGQSTTLTASAPGTVMAGYTWSPSTGLSATTGSSVIASPGATTTYTVTGTDASGCINTSTITINVLSLPNVTASAAPANICPGASSVLTASAGTSTGMSYSWSPATGLSSTVTASVVASPTTTTTYAVTGTDAHGCMGNAIVTVTLLMTPVSISSTSGTAICAGNSTLLTAGTSPTATSVIWSPSTGLSSASGASVTASPTATTTYTATATLGTCVSSSPITITVNPLPTVAPSASPNPVCAGSATTLNANASGASAYSWSPASGVLNPTLASTSAIPSSTPTTYSIIVTSAAGCSASASVTVTTNPPPVVGISATPAAAIGATLTASPFGSGYSYVWTDPNNVIVTPSGSSIAAVLAGNYTVTVTDNSTGCSSTASITISTNYPCAANFVNVVGSSNIGGVLTGTINSWPATNKAYIISGNLTLGADITFDHNAMLMMPGASIHVPNPFKLTIQTKSHLATCPGTTDMWQGINVDLGDARIEVTGSSLIEDAESAITIAPTGFTATGLIKRIACAEAIFNRNGTGINLRNLGVNNNGFISIVNTIFSSRAIPSDFVTWNNTATLKGTPSGATSVPYNLCFNWPTRLACHSGNTPRTGIYLEEVYNTTGTAPGYSYNGITAGEEANGNSDRNLYDAMGSGIEAHNSTLYVRNSSFTQMQPYSITPWYPTLVSSGSVGVYSDADATHKTELSVDSKAGAGVPVNEFYESRAGVESFNNYLSSVTRAFFLGGNYFNIPSSIGQKGIVMHSADYDALTASYNDITNCVDGIWSQTLAGPGRKGRVSVLYNSIMNGSGLTFYNAPTVNTGIRIEQAGAIYPYQASPGVAVGYNIPVSGMYNGIAVIGVRGRPLSIYQNRVQVTPAGKGTQYAIFTADCWGPSISDNSFVGSSSTSNDLLTAIYCGGGVFNPQVYCNLTGGTGRGFYFANVASGGANWTDNNMLSHGRGLVLENSILGTQGKPLSDPAGNKWNGSYTQQTYVTGFPATASTMYVNAASSLENPTLNFGFPTSLSYTTASPASIYSTTKAWQHIYCPGTKSLVINGVSVSNAPIHVLRASLPDSTGRSTWMGQMALYSALRADASLMDTSAALHSFMTAASKSRYEWLCALEDSVQAGAYGDVATMLGSPQSGGYLTGSNCVKVRDTANGDAIFSNYLTYYDLYLKWQARTMTGLDSDLLASLSYKCPLVDGTIIYQARTLRSIVTGELLVYTDTCLCVADDKSEIGGGGSGSSGRIVRNNAEQHYTLLPNPNDGNMALLQSISDEKPAVLKVYNVLGQLIYSGMTAFTMNQTRLNFSHLNAGLYRIVLQEGGGKQYLLKFIKR